MSADRLLYHNEDLLLKVSEKVDRARWDESRYEEYLNELCQGREYQREAILTTLRYLLSGEYRDLRDLARRNFDENPVLQLRYGSWRGMEASLQLPDHQVASLDMATGTGKSYVLYGVAAILLAEGAVDSVLVLCPSLTIEAGLMEKFRSLAENGDLLSLLPEDAVVTVPSVIDASRTITTGSLCVENYHAVLETTGSSIRDSLLGKGGRVAVLNDEAHHVANATGRDSKKWKSFLADSAFGFRMMLGVSGTCYVEDEYFSDVIYRYSLRKAIEERYVKRVEYVDEMPDVRGPDERWQLIHQVHEKARRQTAHYGIRPLTILVTKNIARCKAVAEELKCFLMENQRLDAGMADAQVLTVYNNSPDVPKLRNLDNPANPVEWVVSVSMLNEGWDVKRVFTIVPHEERAFDSKLLISQVLGRGLRIPPSMHQGEQPHVTVFNHEAWASRIRHLVEEVLEDTQRLTSRIVHDSDYHFDLHTIDYDMRQVDTQTKFEGEADFLAKGYVDFATDSAERDVRGQLIDAITNRSRELSATIRQATYDPVVVASEMRDRLGEIDEMNSEDGDSTDYRGKYSERRLLAIVNASMGRVGSEVLTDRMRQRLLAALGPLSRGVSRTVRWTPIENRFRSLSTRDRQADSVGAAELRSTKVVFWTEDARPLFDERQKPFFDEVKEEGGLYRNVRVQNAMDFKVPLSLVIADSENERRFILELKRPENARVLDGWLKSVPMRFYEIDYTWRKGEHQKRGKFSPDFFMKANDTVVVAEVKDDDEVSDPSPENVKKNEYAQRHFALVNEHLANAGHSLRYKFTFITPRDFEVMFKMLREGSVHKFRSNLDVRLDEELAGESPSH